MTTANELLEFIEEVEEIENDIFCEEDDIEEEDVVEEETEEDGEKVTEAFVVRGGKKIKLTPLQAKRLAIKKKLRKEGKLKAGQKLVFKKDSAAFVIKMQTGQEKAAAKKRAKKAHSGAALAKRKRSMKISRRLAG